MRRGRQRRPVRGLPADAVRVGDAVERADSQGRSGDLLRLQLPIDHRLWGESSWIRYWQGRDEDLWTETRA